MGSWPIISLLMALAAHDLTFEAHLRPLLCLSMKSTFWASPTTHPPTHALTHLGSAALSLSMQVKDALLLAIAEEYVEGVEILLHHEEQHHMPVSARCATS